jgi:Mce-associated membrane protein
VSTAAVETVKTEPAVGGPKAPDDKPPTRGTGLVRKAGRGLKAGYSFVTGLPARAVRGVKAVAAAAADRPRRALTIMLVAVLVLGAASGLFVFLAHQQSSVDAAAQDARTTAEKSVVTLLSYDYRSVGGEVAQRQDLTTGQFHDEYGSLIKDVVTPTAQQQQTVTQTTVANSAPTAEESTTRVSVLLFLNQTTTVAGKPDPTFSGSRVRVGMNLVDGRWLVADVTPI